jgi:Ca-activated chloride channel family protein
MAISMSALRTGVPGPLYRGKSKNRGVSQCSGFGTDNIKDSALEKLADHGNGQYAYIDTVNEARKVLVEELGGTLVTVAKDVKIQVEFNPSEVHAYRLIGYENRILQHQDFNDDTKDAGDVGAGQTVTALFEVVPRDVDISLPSVDPLRYQTASTPDRRALKGELMTVKIRYKEPNGAVSRLLEYPVIDRNVRLNANDEDFRFAAAVASFGMILRDSPYKGESAINTVLALAEISRGEDRNGYRAEFINLVRAFQTVK